LSVAARNVGADGESQARGAGPGSTDWQYRSTMHRPVARLGG